MSVGISNRSIVNRELPPVFVLLGGTIVMASFLLCIFYFWAPARERVESLHLTGLRPELNQLLPVFNEFNIDQRYAGEIITGSIANKCRKLVFDNRNGNMWDKGPVRCEDAALQFLAISQWEAARTPRLREISKAFRGVRN